MQFYEFYSDFRSEKSYKGVYVHGLILGNVATTLEDRLQPPRHRLHQGLQVEGVSHAQSPQLSDGGLQLRYGCGSAVLRKLVLHPLPTVLIQLLFLRFRQFWYQLFNFSQEVLARD